MRWHRFELEGIWFTIWGVTADVHISGRWMAWVIFTWKRDCKICSRSLCHIPREGKMEKEEIDTHLNHIFNSAGHHVNDVSRGTCGDVYIDKEAASLQKIEEEKKIFSNV